jgi:hypothetical protein
LHIPRQLSSKPLGGFCETPHQNEKRDHDTNVKEIQHDSPLCVQEHDSMSCLHQMTQRCDGRWPTNVDIRLPDGFPIQRQNEITISPFHVIERSCQSLKKSWIRHEEVMKDRTSSTY